MRPAVALFLLLLGMASPSSADDFEAAQRAYLDHRVDEARRLALPLAQAGDPRAQLLMSRLPFEESDPDWLRLAATNGTPAMRAEYAEELIRRRQRPEAFQLLRQAYDEGYRLAALTLAEQHLCKACGTYSVAEAIEWYSKALKDGILDAAISLGMLYVSGEHVAANAKRAIGFFRQAEMGGMPRPELANHLYQVAREYFEGIDAPRNIKMGHFYHRWAQRLDPAGAMNAVVWETLGLMYLNGRGVSQDAVQGYGYLRRAYEAEGSGARPVMLAYSYMKPPPGIAPNYAEAQRWLLRCVKTSGWCRWRLGELLADENARSYGVPRDLMEAYKWLSLSRLGVPGEVSSMMLDPIMKPVESALTLSQVEEAKRRSAEWARANLSGTAAIPLP